MAKSLKNNLTSAYLDAAHRLASKRSRRRIVAYVESYDDIAFWRTLLSEFENEERYFQVMLPSSTSLTKGKKMVLMNTLKEGALGRNLIACVDSDYDYLTQNATHQSRKINSNPYILQTYTYAIENYHCYAEALHEVCVQATLNDRPTMDFPAFFRRYSEIVHPLFLWHIWFYKRRDTEIFPMHDFHTAIRLGEVNIKQPEQTLETVERNVAAKLKRLQKRFGKYTQQVEAFGRELEALGVTPQTTYLYIQGHNLVDCVVMKLLTPVCGQLRREREAEIKRLAYHREQLRTELAAYENSVLPPSLVLKRNTGYKELPLYERMREDVKQLLKKQ